MAEVGAASELISAGLLRGPDGNWPRLDNSRRRVGLPYVRRSRQGWLRNGHDSAVAAGRAASGRSAGRDFRRLLPLPMELTERARRRSAVGGQWRLTPSVAALSCLETVRYCATETAWYRPAALPDSGAEDQSERQPAPVTASQGQNNVCGLAVWE